MTQDTIWPGGRRQARTSGRLIAGATALAVATFYGITAVPAQAASPTGLTCTDRALSVAITDPGSADQTLRGQLCYRGPREPSTVQLLVHGATYGHVYWDFPQGDGYYSYVNAATLAGYATFNVDRVGYGNSSRPASTQLTAQASAIALHDAISGLRSGAVDGHAFQHVIYVGHSLGSVIGWLEVATYHDVDAVILTGALHTISPSFLAAFTNDAYPAIDDPLFANSGLDTGYLTTIPGTRESLFYNPATADPNVVATDEATKQTVPVAELQSTLGLLSAPPGQSPTQQITVPVLELVGQQDAAFCQRITQYNCADPASVLQFESQYYPPQANLKVVIVPSTGHDLALSTTAPATDAIMLSWALTTVGPYSDSPFHAPVGTGRTR